MNITPQAYMIPGIVKISASKEKVLDSAFKAIEDISGIKKAAFITKSRKHELVICRIAFCKIVKDKTFMTTTKIGACILKDHATVLYLLRKHNDFIQTYKEYIEFFTKVDMRFTELIG